MDGREFIRKAVADLEASGYKGAPPSVPGPKKNHGKGAKKEDTPAVAAPAPAPAPVVLEDNSNKLKTFDHFVMNLPATAIEFLDAFRGLFKGREENIPEPKVQLPMIHCHCFSKSEEPEVDVRERVEAVMGGKLELDSVKLHWVRKVAPNKDMYCISFRLPAEIAFAR